MCHTEPKKEQKEYCKKTKKRNYSKNRSSHEVCGVSPNVGREYMMDKVCERGRKRWAVSERVRELHMMRVMIWQTEMW